MRAGPGKHFREKNKDDEVEGIKKQARELWDWQKKRVHVAAILKSLGRRKSTGSSRREKEIGEQRIGMYMKLS